MKKYKAYLFDLDGTLADSRPGIISSFRQALARFGIQEHDEEKLNSFIGPPIHTTLSTHYGLDEKQRIEAISIYRKSYAESGINDCIMFPNVKNVLKKLKDSGSLIYLATSKPTVFATKILDNFGIAEYFDFVSGADLEGNFCEKPDIIAACLNHLLPDTDKKDIIMVGDRKYDILGAKHHGLDSAGVLCGYGSKKELIDHGADYILPDITGLII